MKYRRLTNEELSELEVEFIRFLASNQVTAPDWEKLKESDPPKVERMIEIFSDMVFANILEKVEYLEFKSPNDIKTFHCEKDRVVMMGIKVEGYSNIDFTRNLSAEQMLQLIQTSNAKLQLYRAEKSYRGERALELFQMMENGCMISKDGALFKTLQSLRKG